MSERSFDVLDPPPRHAWSPEAQRDSDPLHPIPDITVEFPGVTRWFELRRHANQSREHAALLAFVDLAPGLVSDIPIAGADWPYGQPVDVDFLLSASRSHSVPWRDFRVNAIPDPPGTVLRLRRSHDDRSMQFARVICRASREREIEARSSSPAAPFSALCAHFASRNMRMRWMGAFAPAGLTRTAPPDSVAIMMAAYASSLVMDLPFFACDPSLGDSDLDLPLDTTHNVHTEAGRFRLDSVEDAIMDVDPRLGLRVDPGAPDGAGPEWRVCGFGLDGVDPYSRVDIQQLVIQSTASLTHDPRSFVSSSRRSDDRFLARIGHGVSSCLARLSHDASLEEVALLFASEHGLACGHDRRVRRYAASFVQAVHPALDDLRLAVDRVAAIQDDPCRAFRISAAMEAVAPL